MDHIELGIIIGVGVVSAIVLGIILSSIRRRIKKNKLKKSISIINHKILDLIIDIILDGQTLTKDTIETFKNSYSREFGINRRSLLENAEYLEDAIVIIYTLNIDSDSKNQAGRYLLELKEDLSYEN